MKSTWKEMTVGEILQLEYGKPLDESDRNPNGPFPVYGANGEKDRTDKFHHEKPSIIVGRKGSAGEINLTEPKFWPLDVTYFVTFDEKRHDLRFLYYLLATLDLPKLAKGVKPGINRNEVYSQVAKVPSLPEQLRIVGIVDEVFEGIATAKANAKENFKNSRALFESHLQSVFSRRGKIWKNRRLGEIAEVQSGGTPSVSQKNYWGGNIPWYSSGELNETHTTDPERKITEEGLNASNAKMFPKGSLLVGMYDTAALKMSILDRDGTFNQAIAGVKPNDKIVTEFILHAINANKPRLLLERRGVRQKNLSLGKIKEIEIPLPDVAEQRSVVSRLNSVIAETRHLESVYQRKLSALDALKKSLLHQAFSGKL